MFDFLFNPHGRISRKGYLLAYFLPYLLLTQTVSFLAGPVPALAVVSAILSLFYFWPSLVAVPVKRFHDLGITGWAHLVVMLVSLACGLVAMIMLIGPILDDPSAFEDRFEGLEGVAAMREFFEWAGSNVVALLLFILAALIQFGEFLYFAIFPGQRGANQYGEDPLVSGRGFAD